MIDVARAPSLGAALTEALDRWSDETCLVEANRDDENERFTYREFRDASLPLAGYLRALGFSAGDRAALVMTNQSRWHRAAFAIFHAGGVLVPLDFKLTGREHLELLAHCRPSLLVVEHHLWRALLDAAGSDPLPVQRVIVTEAPDGDLGAPSGVKVERFRDARGADPEAPTPRSREDVACIVYSSGTGGRPKGCQLTHGAYLAQLASLTEIHPFAPGVRYLSILPTNHAIDFMVGFLGPYLCGAMVVHLRTLRPEFVRAAFVRYRITHVALVPMVLKNLEAGLRRRFSELSPPRRLVLEALRALYRLAARDRPDPRLGRRLLRGVHQAFGGALEAVFVGGAYTDPDTLRFFHALGIPVANGYGLTEAGTAVSLDRLDPPRPDTVGTPLPGVEVRILEPNVEGVGEIVLRGPTLMRGYLDDPDLTAETIRDGWLLTGDLGKQEPSGHLSILGRRKNMIVTSGGKNVYPEDVEVGFAGIPGVKEHCVFAAHFLWPDRAGRDERLLLVVHPDAEDAAGLLSDYLGFRAEIERRNRSLLDFKRVGGFILWEEPFPRTASLKIKRGELAETIAAKFGDPVKIPGGQGGKDLEVERGVISLT